MKQAKIICDIDIWYQFAKNEIGRIEFLPKNEPITATFINIDALAKSFNNLEHLELTRNVIRHIMKKPDMIIHVPALVYLKQLDDPSFEYTLSEKHQEILDLTQAIANNAEIDESLFKEWIEDRERKFQELADYINAKAEEAKLFQANKKESQVEDKTNWNRIFISQIVKNETGSELSENFDWGQIELFEKVLDCFFWKLVFTNLIMKSSDVYDLLLLIYVQANDKIWIKDTQGFFSCIKEANMEKYIFNYEMKEQGLIDSVKIQNFYSIKQIELNELRDKKFIFILGENGSGKTIFLKSLLLSLRKRFIDKTASKEVTGIIEDIFKQNEDFRFRTVAYDDTTQWVFEEKKNNFLKNIYAYGTNRHETSTDKADIYGFMTLFKGDEFLINPEQWLQKTRFAELENKEKNINNVLEINDIEKILSDLLEIKSLKLEVNSQRVKFLVAEKEFSLSELSQGFKSTITFIIDLIARIIENNPKIKETKDFNAVVLIDELDLFLHPTWEKVICNKLHKWFPNIQFFITTHSPILIDGAIKSKELVDKTIVFKFENIDNQTKLTHSYEGEDIETWLPNILISSYLFDPNFFDEMPKEFISKARTEKSFQQMLQTNQNFEVLKEKEEKIKMQYLKKLQKGKQDD